MSAPTDSTHARTNYGSFFTAYNATKYCAANPATYGSFGLTAHSFRLVLCLGYRANQQEEGEE